MGSDSHPQAALVQLLAGVAPSTIYRDRAASAADTARCPLGVPPAAGADVAAGAAGLTRAEFAARYAGLVAYTAREEDEEDERGDTSGGTIGMADPAHPSAHIAHTGAYTALKQESDGDGDEDTSDGTIGIGDPADPPGTKYGTWHIHQHGMYHQTSTAPARRGHPCSHHLSISYLSIMLLLNHDLLYFQRQQQRRGRGQRPV